MNHQAKDDDDDVKDNHATYQSHADCNDQHDDAWYAVKLYITEQLIFQYGFNPEIVRDVIEKVIVDVSVMPVDNNDMSNQVVQDDQNTSISSVVTGIEVASIGCEAAKQNLNSSDTQNQRYHHNHDNVQELVDLCCQYILENNLDVDRGGPIAPIGDCPHLETASTDSILHDYIITFTNNTTPSSGIKPHQDDEHFVPNRLSEESIAVLACTNYYHPEISSCSHIFRQDEHNDESQQLASPHTYCSSQVENWLCYCCGVVRCSRYVHGHNIQHWKDTIESSSNEKSEAIMTKKDTNEQSVIDHGHCIAISLHDLSVWCHQCQSYIFHPTLLGPVLDYLQTMKYPSIQHERIT